MATARTPLGLGQPQLVGRQLARAALPVFCSSLHTTLPFRAPSRPPAKASFSTSATVRMRDFFPAQETAHIRKTPPVWPHHGYTEAELLAVTPGHRTPETLGDRIAWRLMRICRWGMDTATGMRTAEEKKPLTEAQWLARFIFLESIAGVPGMVAGMLRHLHALRRLTTRNDDNGWIETLLEESYNERMHLMTFMKMCEPPPGWFMRLMVLGAQGVYFNVLFFWYLVHPRVCHRFVGYLEEEAVHTYTRCLAEMDAGHTPAWTTEDPAFQVPEMAVTYWKMPEGRRTMRDLILYIRADEASHRGVNHTLGNLEQKTDPNPFVSEYKEGRRVPNPLERPQGYERRDVI